MLRITSRAFMLIISIFFLSNLTLTTSSAGLFGDMLNEVKRPDFLKKSNTTSNNAEDHEDTIAVKPTESEKTKFNSERDGGSRDVGSFRRPDSTSHVDVGDSSQLSDFQLANVKKADKAELDHFISMLKIQTDALLWQGTASNTLLWVVVIVTLSGVLFSGYQLIVTLRKSTPQGDSTVEISANRIRITTSVTGVVVLAISLAFLYLFLIEVYRINVIDLNGTNRGQSQTNSKPVK